VAVLAADTTRCMKHYLQDILFIGSNDVCNPSAIFSMLDFADFF
jgi:hypothetical protein